MQDKHTILILTQDSKGLIYKVSSLLFEANLNIEKNDEFVNKEENIFFMRTEVSGTLDPALQAHLESTLPPHSQIKIIPQKRKSILLLATKESHCLGDLLLRVESGELEVDIKAVISNHENLRGLVERFALPFVHIPHEGLSREMHEARVLEECQKYAVDYLVLAKYMRILSPSFVAEYEQKIINIHHSFLPAFIGANPYKQAFERGVKIIGATAHFVNNDLDDGPIIAQDIIRIDHSYSWREMQKAGRNIEKIVLARALELALQDRIFIHDNKTIVF